MFSAVAILEQLGWTATLELVQLIDDHLSSQHPEFFDPKCRLHPCLPLKARKLINDNIWGVQPFYWPELALIDTPVVQRLRRIHQTSLAYYTYPSMRHSRFEHTLGVVVAADLMYRHLHLSRDTQTVEFMNRAFRARGLEPPARNDPLDDPIRLEMRLAALLHDTGHSLFSHTSEPHYGGLEPVAAAREQLKEALGKDPGPGEVVSAAFAWSRAVHEYLEEAHKRCAHPDAKGRFHAADQFEIGLLILGVSSRPETQFVADIISSALDADKLDYLRRDGQAAGLEISFSFDRLLWMLLLRDETPGKDLDISDPLVERRSRFFADVSQIRSALSMPGGGEISYPQKQGRCLLRIAPGAVGPMEQIVTARMILLGSVYHHRKVRAADVMLSRILDDCVRAARSKHIADKQILRRFVAVDDWSLVDLVDEFSEQKSAARRWLARLQARVLPRCVFEIRGVEQQDQRITEFVKKLGSLVDQIEAELSAQLQDEAWIDIADVGGPQNPFGMLVMTGAGSRAPMPFAEWLQSYESTRRPIGIFVFSESFDRARKIIPEVVGRPQWLGDKALAEGFVVSR